VANGSEVHRVKVKGPSTHALIIGVGFYPHLMDGSGSLSDRWNFGLGQLTSPPLSARAVASWLIKNFRNPDCELGSVRLLVSEKRSKPFKNPRTGKATVPAVASIDGIATAVDDWFDDGNRDEANQLVFFFAGHGLGNPPLLSLLTQSYGEKADAFDGAIDFNGLRSGMNECKARRQCFFVDACQANTVAILRSRHAGRPLRTPDDWDYKDPKIQPIIYSTYPGGSSASNKNEPTFFTQGLLEGLKGRGGDRSSGKWGITSRMLDKAISCHLRHTSPGQRTTPIGVEDVFIHCLDKPPEVSVTVTCDESLALACNRGATVLHERTESKEPWQLELEAGIYEFVGSKKKRRISKSDYVAPPEHEVPLK
jgi:hypothetical protein